MRGGDVGNPRWRVVHISTAGCAGVFRISGGGGRRQGLDFPRRGCGPRGQWPGPPGSPSLNCRPRHLHRPRGRTGWRRVHGRVLFAYPFHTQPLLISSSFHASSLHRACIEPVSFLPRFCIFCPPGRESPAETPVRRPDRPSPRRLKLHKSASPANRKSPTSTMTARAICGPLDRPGPAQHCPAGIRPKNHQPL